MFAKEQFSSQPDHVQWLIQWSPGGSTEQEHFLNLTSPLFWQEEALSKSNTQRDQLSFGDLTKECPFQLPRAQKMKLGVDGVPHSTTERNERREEETGSNKASEVLMESALRLHQRLEDYYFNARNAKLWEALCQQRRAEKHWCYHEGDGAPRRDAACTFSIPKDLVERINLGVKCINEKISSTTAAAKLISNDREENLASLAQSYDYSFVLKRGFYRYSHSNFQSTPPPSKLHFGDLVKCERTRDDVNLLPIVDCEKESCGDAHHQMSFGHVQIRLIRVSKKWFLMEKLRQLHLHCHCGGLGAVKLFVEEYGNGILEGQSRKGFRALHVAAMSLKYDVCEYLILERKVEVNCVTRRGETPLMAALRGHRIRKQDLLAQKQVIALLLENGADKMITTPTYHGVKKVASDLKRYHYRPVSPLAFVMRYTSSQQLDLLCMFLSLCQNPENAVAFCDNFSERKMCAPDTQNMRFPRTYFQMIPSLSERKGTVDLDQLRNFNRAGGFTSYWHWVLGERDPSFEATCLMKGRSCPDHSIQIPSWIFALPNCGTEALLKAARDFSTEKTGHVGSTGAPFFIGPIVTMHFPDAVHRVPSHRVFGNEHFDDKDSIWIHSMTENGEEEGKIREKGSSRSVKDATLLDGFSTNSDHISFLLGEQTTLTQYHSRSKLYTSQAMRAFLQRPGVFECLQL